MKSKENDFNFVFLCLFSSIMSVIMQAHTPVKPDGYKFIPFMYNSIAISKDLQLQKVISQGKILLIPIVLAIATYGSRGSIAQYINDYPVPFMAVLCLLGNYLIDSISKYRQITQSLNFFMFAQKMSHYLLCLLAIKNRMQNLKINNETQFDEEECLATVVNYTGYSISELETFTFELLKISMNSINHLGIDIDTSTIESEIYLFFKDQITIEQMFLICKNEPIVCAALIDFHNNPKLHYEQVMQMLCLLIHTHFNYFIKQKLHID